MRSRLSLWTNVLTKLGFKRNKHRSRKRTSYRRVLRFEQFEDRRMLAMFMVTNDGDAPENTPAAVGTLRQAIFDANQQLVDPDRIEFAPSLDNATILLDVGLGELFITDSLTIDASMLGSLTIDANDPDRNDPEPVAGNGIRIFNIDQFMSTVDVQFVALTLTGGDPIGRDGGDPGGAIRCSANTLELRNCVISGNQSLRSGGDAQFVLAG